MSLGFVSTEKNVFTLNSLVLCVVTRLRHSLCFCLSLPRLEAASGLHRALMDGAGLTAVQQRRTVFPDELTIIYYTD